MRLFNKVKNVKPLPDFWLDVEFLDGTKKLYDVKPLIAKLPPFQSLLDIKGLFEQVKVDVGGYGVIWNDDLDLSCDSIYHG